MLISPFFEGKIEVGNCLQQSRQEFINIQPIKEKLLRLATKWTESYASDILYFFDAFNELFLEKEVVEVDFYFRNAGIDTAYLFKDFRIEKDFTTPDRYRGVAKLTFDGKDMALYWNAGNC